MTEKRLSNAQWEWIAQKYIQGRYSAKVMGEFAGVSGFTVQSQIKNRTGGKEEQEKFALCELEDFREEFEALSGGPFQRQQVRRAAYSKEQIKWLGDRFKEGYSRHDLAKFAHFHPNYIGLLMNKIGIKKHSGRNVKKDVLPELNDRWAEFLALDDEREE